MKKQPVTFVVIVCILMFVGSVIAYLANTDSGFWFWTRNILYLAAPILSISAGRYALSVYGLRNYHAVSIFLIVIGLVLWFVGEVVFTSYVIVDIDPFPSIADFFYLIGYPFMVIGFWRESLHGRHGFTKREKATYVISLALLAAVVFYFGMYQAYDPELSTLTNIIAMSYGIGDLLLLSAVIRVVIFVQRHTGGSIAMPWTVIFFGIMATLIADILYAMFNELYDAGNYAALQIDLVFIAGYLLLAIGFVQLGSLIRSVQNRLTERTPK